MNANAVKRQTLLVTNRGFDQLATDSFPHTLSVLIFHIPTALTVPQVVNLRGEESILPNQSGVMQSQYKIRIFMPPAHKGLIETVDRDVVRLPE